MVKRYKQNEIDELADILRNGGIISVPTDTVYGLCGMLNSVKAYNKLMSTKKRPMNKSFPIMCANEEQIKSIAIVDSKAEKLIRTFMPGPITLVLKKKNIIQDYASNGKDTIAVRMATSNHLKKLIERVGCPIFMTSANQSGQPTCTNLDEIEKKFPNLDGMMEGIVKFREASTIVDCSLDRIKILREGPISIDEITKKLE